VLPLLHVAFNRDIARCFITSSVSRSIDDFHFRKSFPFHLSMITKQPGSGLTRTLKTGVKTVLIIEGLLLLGSYGFWRRLNTSQGELLRLRLTKIRLRFPDRSVSSYVAVVLYSRITHPDLFSIVLLYFFRIRARITWMKRQQKSEQLKKRSLHYFLFFWQQIWFSEIFVGGICTSLHGKNNRE